MKRTEEENQEGAELLRRLKAIAHRMGGDGVDIGEVQMMLDHDAAARRVRQRLRILGYTDVEIERAVFR